jgi:hypothetical protein
MACKPLNPYRSSLKNLIKARLNALRHAEASQQLKYRLKSLHSTFFIMTSPIHQKAGKHPQGKQQNYDKVHSFTQRPIVDI